MKVYEVINFNKELLKNIQTAGIRLEDIRYIDLFSEYKDMKTRGEKVTYIVAALAVRYRISERKVYDIIRRFKCDCNTHCR